MTQKQFDALIQEQVNVCLAILKHKGEEYAPSVDVEAPIGDRLEHFRRAAGLQNESIEKSVFGMLAKHLASIAEMCEAPADFDTSKWMEKLTDSINYLLILSAVVNRENKNVGSVVAQSQLDVDEHVRGGLSI